jgi:hypothetical protein
MYHNQDRQVLLSRRPINTSWERSFIGRDRHVLDIQPESINDGHSSGSLELQKVGTHVGYGAKKQVLQQRLVFNEGRVFCHCRLKGHSAGI